MIGDRTRVREIATNLLANAVKFTDAGGVHATVRAHAGDGRLTVTLAVSDTGIGIAPEHQARIFQPFEQVDTSYSRRHGGTGLGLAIANQLCRWMGGSLSVKSAPGQGSTFTATIVLDLDPNAEVGADVPAPPPRQEEIPPPGGKPAASSAILVVEDDPVGRELMRYVLRGLGYEPDVVGQGSEALAALEARPYDLLLLDIQMPEMDGFELARRVRDRFGSRPRLVALTAAALESDRERCLAAGMDGYLSKPMRPEQLAEVIDSCLAATG
ncbi:MAG: ATP-binding protein [Acidobacteriota bacterium]